jgi:hypothetical protein
MRDQIMSKPDMRMVPSWVPEAALHYLAHIESGLPIRVLARRSGRHASTVLRQIRACETRRDDLLIDEALRRLGQRVGGAKKAGSPAEEANMTVQTNSERPEDDGGTLSNARLQAEARRVLRRLCETGALLAVSVDMDKAVVVRDGGSGQPSRTAVVDREVAEALALKGWIACEDPGRIARYHITGRGRAALGEMLAAAENAASGLREPPVVLRGTEDVEGPEARRRMRYGLAESPLIALARRRDRDGSRFLSPDLVRAGERLREDFELAQMGRASPRTGTGFSAMWMTAAPPPARWPIMPRPRAPASSPRCAIWGRGWAMWRCAAAATWRGWSAPRKKWAGRRGRARSCCASPCNGSGSITKGWARRAT